MSSTLLLLLSSLFLEKVLKQGVHSRLLKGHCDVLEKEFTTQIGY